MAIVAKLSRSFLFIIFLLVLINFSHAQNNDQVNIQNDTNSSYIVLPGDTLWDISVKLYGSGIYYKDIALANNLVNPKLIHKGNTLRLPAIATSSNASLRCANPIDGLRDVSCLKSIEDIYTGYEFNLPQLPLGHPVRLEVEKELSNSIKKAINEARNNRNLSQAKLLLSSMKEKDPEHKGPTFSSWMARWGRILGKEDSYKIGMGITSQMNFTIEEAEKIINSAK